MTRTYIGRQQATVSRWVVLRPLFEVCTRETAAESGPWGRAQGQAVEDSGWQVRVKSKWEALSSVRGGRERVQTEIGI